jgi:hypothetical protein
VSGESSSITSQHGSSKATAGKVPAAASEQVVAADSQQAAAAKWLQGMPWPLATLPGLPQGWVVALLPAPAALPMLQQ